MERTLEPNGAVPTVPGHVGLEQRPDALLGQVGQRAQRFGLAGQHQVADRHAAGVHAHDLRRQHAGRHDGLGPVGLADDLGHRLGHVGAGVERQLDQGDLLDALRLDALDAVDVLEVQLELVDDQPFHLGGAHAVVVLDDVDLRQVERREDVDAHAERRPARRRRSGHDQHHHRDGMTQCEIDGVHDAMSRRSHSGGRATGRHAVKRRAYSDDKLRCEKRRRQRLGYLRRRVGLFRRIRW